MDSRPRRGLNDMSSNSIQTPDLLNELMTFEEYASAIKNLTKELAKGRRAEAKKEKASELKIELENIKTKVKAEEEARDKSLTKLSNKELKERRKQIQKELDYNYKLRVKLRKKLLATESKEEQSIIQKELNEVNKSIGKLGTESAGLNSRKRGISSAFSEVDWAGALSKGVNNLLSNTLNSINSGMEAYSKNQVKINTRLMGSRTFGLYNKFGAIETGLTNAVGVNPYFKTQDMLDNLNALVEAGIVSNLEQRAFLMTASENIATTFDAANGTLLRIIRLQQSDSTAARLGMEAYLTRFLNNLVENTEYMNQTFDNVASALLEASSAMGVAQATEFEYVVQKWLGALTGTGLSEASAQSIAQAIGYLGSGNISALGGTNMLNLVTMAASRAGMDIGSILTGGLNNKSTDLLMKSLVEYMVELGGNSSNVVKSELAQTFGLTYSDLVAAKQLNSSIGDIYGNRLSNLGMYGELAYDMSTMALRTPMASMIGTLWDNLQFGLASNIAKNPALSAMWKVTDLIQGTTGGINLPTIGVMGNMIDLETTVENLIKTGIVGIGSLGMIGDLVSGLGSTLAPVSILGKLGINPLNTGISRGGMLSALTSGLTSSFSSTTVRANSSGSDISESALTGAMDSAKEKQKAQAQEEEQYINKEEEGFESDMKTIVSTLNKILDRMDGEFEVSNYNVDASKFSSDMMGIGF